MEGRILERIALFEQLTQLVGDLFRMYIQYQGLPDDGTRNWSKSAPGSNHGAHQG
jgi:hypothetical protein